MVDDDPRSMVRPTEFALVVGWLAAMGVLATLPVGAWLAIDAAAPRVLHPALSATLHGTAVLLAAASLVARSRLLSDRRLREYLARYPPSGAAGEPSARPPTARFTGLGAWARPAFVLGWTINTLIAGLGVGLAVHAQAPSTMLPFVFAAFALNALMYPRLTVLLRRAVHLSGMPLSPRT